MARKTTRKAAKKKAKKPAKKAAKKPAKKAAKKPAKKAARKPAKAAARKPAKKAAKRKPARKRAVTEAVAAIESTVRNYDVRPATELASELETETYGVDLHNDPSVEITTESAATEAAATWRVAKSLLKLRAQVNAMAPGRSKVSDGTIGDVAHCGSSSSTSDHCPRITDAGIGVVAAMDITHDAAGGCDAGKLAKALHASRDSRIKYIIWNRKIANSSPQGASPAWTWRDYNGANPHNHHVHISVKPSKPQYDSESSWTLTGG